MTDSEHLEVSRKLALAIGWPSLFVSSDGALFVADDNWTGRFDYRDWRVAGPIAEKFDCFPCKRRTGAWESFTYYGPIICADTPQLAIALAVIAAQGVK